MNVVNLLTTMGLGLGLAMGMGNGLAMGMGLGYIGRQHNMHRNQPWHCLSSFLARRVLSNSISID